MTSQDLRDRHPELWAEVAGLLAEDLGIRSGASVDRIVALLVAASDGLQQLRQRCETEDDVERLREEFVETFAAEQARVRLMPAWEPSVQPLPGAAGGRGVIVGSLVDFGRPNKPEALDAAADIIRRLEAAGITLIERRSSVGATRIDGIAGFCPMGCGLTLFVADGGYVTCHNLYCKRPDAVADLLDDRETEHVVEFNEAGFAVRHPLRERLDAELIECDLDSHIADWSGPPIKPGRYRARSAVVGRWTWEELPPKPAPAVDPDETA